MRAAWLMLPSLALGAGCLRSTEFRCMTNEQCGPTGTCQQTVGAFAPPIDAPAVACPADFAPLNGAPAGSHVYKRLPTNANWATQHDACTALAGKTYLAVPDDAAELTGIAGVAQVTPFWVGVDDRATEGTYVRSNDLMPATFKPWDAANGEPDNPGGGGGQDCVASTATLFSTEDCTGGAASRPAVCECEPPP